MRVRSLFSARGRIGPVFPSLHSYRGRRWQFGRLAVGDSRLTYSPQASNWRGQHSGTQTRSERSAIPDLGGSQRQVAWVSTEPS